MARRDWLWLTRWSASAVFVLLAVVGITSGDRETIVIAVALLVAILLLRWRTGLIGLLGAGFLAADIALWMVPAAVINLSNGEGLRAVLVPSALASLSLVLLVAVVASLLGRRRPASPGRGPIVAAGLCGVAVLAAVVAGLLGGADGPEPGDVLVDMSDTAFDPDRLEVPAGPVAFYVSNDDLFWHTFTVEGTDIDVRMATRGHRRVEADLAPGTYEIVCTIPGHESVGMTGVLEVH